MTRRDKTNNKENHNPTLVYVCGKSDSEIRQTILDELSKTCFVHSSTAQKSSQRTDFATSCYAITSSSAFIFIMDSTSVLDVDCLSLLGTAIAFDIPIIGIREAGYALPYEIPKLFGKVEIVDRSRPFEYKLACKSLPAVTTLASALKVLFTQSVIYHERIKGKCMKEIVGMLSGVRINRVISKKFEHFEEGNVYSESGGSETNGGGFEIKDWPPQANGIKEHLPDNSLNNNKRSTAVSRKTPEQRKPLGPSPPNVMKPLSRQNSKKVMNITKCKIRVHSPDGNDPSAFSLTSEKNSAPIKNNSENVEKSKPRANTVHTNNTQNTEQRKPYHKLRRLSSLPCIKTNYMVTSEEQRSQPKIYHFPMSPRLEKRTSNLNRGQILDDDDDRLHLSRTCSPIDFASDDGALSPG